VRKPPARGGRRRGGEEVGGLIRLRYVSRIMPVLRPSSVSAIAFFPAPGRLADGSYIPRAHERRVSLQALEALCCWHHKPACHSPFRPVQACASSRLALHLTRSSSGKRLAGQRQTGGARKEMAPLGLTACALTPALKATVCCTLPLPDDAWAVGDGRYAWTAALPDVHQNHLLFPHFGQRAEEHVHMQMADCVLAPHAGSKTHNTCIPTKTLIVPRLCLSCEKCTRHGT
jgi:hypothetical protein